MLVWSRVALCIRLRLQYLSTNRRHYFSQSLRVRFQFTETVHRRTVVVRATRFDRRSALPAMYDWSQGCTACRREIRFAVHCRRKLVLKHTILHSRIQRFNIKHQRCIQISWWVRRQTRTIICRVFVTVFIQLSCNYFSPLMPLIICNIILINV